MGLVLGVASGAALVETLRARPAAPREVRVTVSPDAIPRRRAATLADDAFVGAPAEPARGGPADRRGGGLEMPSSGPDRRTPVRVEPATASIGTPLFAQPAGQIAHDPTHGLGRPQAALVGIPVSGGEDPMLRAMRVSAATATLAEVRRGTAVGVLDAPAAAAAVVTAV